MAASSKPLPSPAAQAGRSFERAALTINPGGWTVQDTRPIATLLGSCVAVCLYDPKLQLAGMNHFLLPSRKAQAGDDTDVILSGDYAMEVLRNAMYARGASPSRLVAKAFGGGNVVNSIRMAVGERNASFAREWLAREKIPLMASDFGGAWSRKVVFDPLSGDVYCRRNPINRPDVEAVIRAENAYEKTLLTPRQIAAQEKKIELF